MLTLLDYRLMWKSMRNYFATWELVPWQVWKMLGENARHLVSGRLIHALNMIRHELGKSMTCNTKGEGGRDQSGLRIAGQKHYRPTSRHAGNHDNQWDGNRGLAADAVGHWDPREIHAMILKQPTKYHMVKFIEIDINWLHIDVRDRAELGLWSPTRGFVSKAAYIQELKKEGFW